MTPELQARLDAVKADMEPQCSLTAKAFLVALLALEHRAAWGDWAVQQDATRDIEKICDVYENKK